MPKELLSVLSLMQPICTKKTTAEVTNFILFTITSREMTIKATDMEVSLQATINVDSSLEESASFLVSGKRIFDLVKEIDTPINCIVLENRLQVKASGVDVELNIRSTDEFPPFPERIENLMAFDANLFLELLNKVVFLIPNNNANMALNGLLLRIDEEQLLMVATDGHCLSYIRTDAYKLGEKKQWLIPKRAALELKKLLELNLEEGEHYFLGICGHQLVFSGKNFNFFTRLIAEPFPHFEPILERKDFVPAQLSKTPFLKTLKRASCLLAGQFLSTTFFFSGDALKVQLYNKEVGKLEELLALENFEGTPVESKFYSPYLLNGLQAFTEDHIRLFVKNNNKPIIFESANKNYDFIYLVMPVSSSHG